MGTPGGINVWALNQERKVCHPACLHIDRTALSMDDVSFSRGPCCCVTVIPLVNTDITTSMACCFQDELLCLQILLTSYRYHFLSQVFSLSQRQFSAQNSTTSPLRAYPYNIISQKITGMKNHSRKLLSGKTVSTYYPGTYASADI